jgi:hypothetical protein
MDEKLAYKYISDELLAFANGRNWDKVSFQYGLFNGMVETQKTILTFDGMDDYEYHEIPFEIGCKSLEAILFLKEYILNLTGDRIWGLTFTLYPTGKFNIEYDYNKPEDYDDSDETITGEEVNQSLYDLGFRAAPTDKAPKGNE